MCYAEIPNAATRLYREINEKTDENRHLATTPNSASMFQQGCSARDLHKTSRECKREGMLSKIPCAALTTRNLTKSMEKAEKQFLQREFWLFPQATEGPGRANLLPCNKPETRRNGRELAMNGPKYTSKKLEKCIKRLKHKHKAHTTFYWEREDLRKLGGKDSTYCPRLKNQKS